MTYEYEYHEIAPLYLFHFDFHWFRRGDGVVVVNIYPPTYED